ncbi:2-dehydropantoate 2-reductase (plasmid) [Streptomycetaceae bacterium NBC_01309]
MRRYTAAPVSAGAVTSRAVPGTPDWSQGPVCVVGPGAVGGVVAAALLAAGLDVEVLGRPGPHLDAVARHGFRVDEAATGARTVARPSRVTSHAHELRRPAAIVLAVKAPGLDGAAEAIERLGAPDVPVVCALNGVPWWFFDDSFAEPLRQRALHSLDPSGRIREVLPAERVIGCVVQFSAAVVEPGVIRRLGGSQLTLGEAARQGLGRDAHLAAALTVGGLTARVSADIRAEVWAKLLGNVNFNPISALTGATVDLIVNDPLVSELCVSMMREVIELGEKLGIRTSVTPEERMRLTGAMGAFETSMLQDHRRGRPLELATIVAAVVDMAEHVGLPAPATRAVLGLSRLLQHVAHPAVHQTPDQPPTSHREKRHQFLVRHSPGVKPAVRP